MFQTNISFLFEAKRLLNLEQGIVPGLLSLSTDNMKV